MNNKKHTLDCILYTNLPLSISKTTEQLRYRTVILVILGRARVIRPRQDPFAIADTPSSPHFRFSNHEHGRDGGLSFQIGITILRIRVMSEVCVYIITIQTIAALTSVYQY